MSEEKRVYQCECEICGGAGELSGECSECGVKSLTTDEVNASRVRNLTALVASKKLVIGALRVKNGWLSAENKSLQAEVERLRKQLELCTDMLVKEEIIPF